MHNPKTYIVSEYPAYSHQCAAEMGLEPGTWFHVSEASYLRGLEKDTTIILYEDWVRRPDWEEIGHILDSTRATTLRASR